MKAVIDTNIIVSSFRGGNHRKVIDLLDEGAFKLCISPSITEEYFRVLQRFPFTKEELEKIIHYCETAESVDSIFETPRLDIVKNDPSDNKFIECAVALNADYIITGDNDLLVIEHYEQIQIVTPREFVELAEYAKRKK